ncbi:hypothetical protein [Luteolibacter soli]|uniref:Uncharacterized protein n=1 Tax=Luteolibacter soli TaxID=3135280 RepID=A0ABU9AYE9_9BACT
MPRRPIHRWKSFWLGILIIELLYFDWPDSKRIVIDIRAGDRTCLLEHHTRVTRFVPGWPVREDGLHYSRRTPGGPNDVPAICIERHLPCYQLHDLTAFIPLWTIFLITRSCRMKRHAATDDSTLTETSE